MSIMSRSLTSYNNLLNILHNRSYYYKPTHHIFRSFFFVNRRISHFHQLVNRNSDNNNSHMINYRIGLLSTRNLHYLTTIQRLQNERKFTRNITVYASIQPGPPLPPGAPKNSWISWIFGILVSIILPFFTSKWGPLIKWTEDVESTVDKVEQLVDVVQVMAKKVDEAAEEFSSDIPEGQNLKKAVALVEDVAEEIAKDAKFAEKIINKVQGAEEKLDNQVDEPNK